MSTFNMMLLGFIGAKVRNIFDISQRIQSIFDEGQRMGRFSPNPVLGSLPVREMSVPLHRQKEKKSKDNI
ncbi:MAG: hypothetical protein IJ614_03280 [Prevotella sp.]|nr:hypothetical protein [Prevotella sp.]